MEWYGDDMVNLQTSLKMMELVIILGTILFWCEVYHLKKIHIIFLEESRLHQDFIFWQSNPDFRHYLKCKELKQFFMSRNDQIHIIHLVCLFCYFNFILLRNVFYSTLLYLISQRRISTPSSFMSMVKVKWLLSYLPKVYSNCFE